MQYFQLFPKIDYNSTETVSGVSQIIKRNIPNMTVKLELNVFNNGTVSFEEYRIKDRDRPDTVAAQMYGNSRYAWIIMLANNMRDLYDWPMTDLQFFNYMNSKYETTPGANDGFEASQSVVYQYIRILDDGREVVVDETAYASLPLSYRRVITAYDHEYNENDAKRTIRLISLESLPEVLKQFNEVISK